MKEKVAICKSPSGTTFGYIYKAGDCFGYYMCGFLIPEKQEVYMILRIMCKHIGN